MSEPPVGQSDKLSLDSLTLALVVNGMGTCTDDAVADLRRYVRSKAITHSSLEFDSSLARAKQHFLESNAHFFLCDGEPCRQQRGFKATSNALQHEAERIGCRISPTALQASTTGIAACRAGM